MRKKTYGGSHRIAKQTAGNTAVLRPFSEGLQKGPKSEQSRYRPLRRRRLPCYGFTFVTAGHTGNCRSRSACAPICCCGTPRRPNGRRQGEGLWFKPLILDAGEGYYVQPTAREARGCATRPSLKMPGSIATRLGWVRSLCRATFASTVNLPVIPRLWNSTHRVPLLRSGCGGREKRNSSCPWGRCAAWR
jgi:hypothetical protein